MQVNELKDEIAQMIADNEDLVEKAAQSDQLREWVEQVNQLCFVSWSGYWSMLCCSWVWRKRTIEKQRTKR